MVLDRGIALLEAPFSPQDWAADTVAKQIYADCVDVDKREEIGVRPILNILRSMNRCQTSFASSRYVSRNQNPKFPTERSLNYITDKRPFLSAAYWWHNRWPRWCV